VKSSFKRNFKAWHWITVCVLAVTAPAFVSSLRSSATSPAYTITDLGTLGGSPNQSRAYGINNCGTTVGDSLPPASSFNHAFYKKGATMTDIPSLGAEGSAYSLNSFGYTVGYSSASIGQRAFLWHDDDDDGISDPGELNNFLPAGAIGVAYEINDSNRVVGLVDASGGSSLSDSAFVWDATNGLQILPGVTGLSPTRALGINNAGTIAGWAVVSLPPYAPTHAFILKNNTYINLGTLNNSTLSLSSFAWRISEDNHVVGYSQIPSGNALIPIHPFVWFDANNNNTSDAGEMQDLGTLSGTNAYGYDINATGYVVGTSEVTGGATHGYVWHDDNSNGVSDPGEMKDLNTQFSDANWTTLTEARSINDSGQIVGWGTKSNGETHAFLLTPTTGFIPTPCPGSSPSPSPSPTPATTTLISVQGNGTYGGTADLFAILYSNDQPVNGKTISFTLNGTAVCGGGTGVTCPTTNASGVATLSGVSLAGINAGSYPTAVGASFAGDSSYAAANQSGLLTVNKAATTITWNNPADIVYGTALSGTQLNATASVAGTFTYTPAAGAVLNAGNNQTLHVDFTPTDGNNYTGASKNVLINVNKATPTITWNNPADIVYGTALSGTQLNAASSAPGTFSYTPAAGTILHVGNSQTLRADFTPTDTTNYNTPAQKTVSINVLKATLTITADNKARPLNTANPPLTYTPTGFVNGDTASVLAGSPNLSTTATQSSAAGDYPITITQGTLTSADYAFTFVNGTLSVGKVAPIINWSNPANIVYGTALSGTQLNATATDPNSNASVAGTFTYAPAAGAVLHAGNNQMLVVNFTPTDATNYITPPQKTVTINVSKATLTITADNKMKLVGDPNPALTFTPAGFVNGDSATVLTGAPSLSTTATTGSPVGNYPITITQGTLGAADYAFTFVNGTLSVTEAAPVILLEMGTSNAAAVDSVTYVRSPFRVTNNVNFSSDHITRIIIFTLPLGLTSPPIPPTSTLSVQASGINLPVEAVGNVTGVTGLNASYIVVSLVPGMPTGDLQLTVTRNGVVSNAATLTIIP